MKNLDQIKEQISDLILEQDSFIHAFPILEMFELKTTTQLYVQSMSIVKKYKLLRQKGNFKAFINMTDFGDEEKKCFKKVSELFLKVSENDFNKDLSEKFCSICADTEGYNFNTQIDPLLKKMALQEIYLPSSDKLNSPEAKHNFKSLMMDCQDKLAIKHFDRAWNISTNLKLDSEPESAQLYEFLLVSYYHQQNGAQSIIQDALFNNGDKCDHVLHFANRCKTLNEKQNATQTAKIIIELIYTDLIRELNFKYAEMDCDYITSENNREDYRKQIAKYIDLGIEMLESINSMSKPIKDFSQNVLNELTGGGKLNWLDIGYQWHVRDAFYYPATKKREQVISFLKRHTLWSDTFQKEINDKLYFNLIKKYNKIGVHYNAKETTVQFQKTYRFIKATKAAYCLLKDKRFLNLTVSELKGYGKFSWFEIDEKNEIDEIGNNKNCGELNYQPKIDLRRIIDQLGNESETYEQTLKEILALLKEANRYQSAHKSVEEANFIYEANCLRSDIHINPEVRQNIIDAMCKWREAALILNDMSLIDKCINELKGCSGLDWFELLEDENQILFENHPSCNEICFDSKHLLDDLCKKKGTLYESVEKEIKDLLALKREDKANKAYEHYSSISRTINQLENRGGISDCIKDWIFCCRINPKTELVEKSITEIVGDGLLDWFELTDSLKVQPTGEAQLHDINYGKVKQLLAFLPMEEQQEYQKNLVKRLYSNAINAFKEKLLNRINLSDVIEKRNKIIDSIKVCFYGWQKYELNGFADQFIDIGKTIMRQDTCVMWAIKVQLDKITAGKIINDIIQQLSEVEESFLRKLLFGEEVFKPNSANEYEKGLCDDSNVRPENPEEKINWKIVFWVNVIFIGIAVILDWKNYVEDSVIMLFFILLGMIDIILIAYFHYTVENQSKKARF